jgi:hypothetical protein
MVGKLLIGIRSLTNQSTKRPLLAIPPLKRDGGAKRGPSLTRSLADSNNQQEILLYTLSTYLSRGETIQQDIKILQHFFILDDISLHMT